MSRGVRRERNIEEELAIVDAKINKHEKSIAELKNARSQLEEQQYRKDASRLMQAVSSSGISVDDAVAKLSAQ